LADPEIDAIYNPLPNGLHAEWSIRALEAGKHVLCEKPLAVTATEARTMFDTARRRGLHVVEGYPFRSQQQTLKLQELLNEGAIGKPQLIQASFGFTLKDGPNIRLDSALGGGALMDVGSYTVSLARMIAKERPIRVNAMANWTATNIDRTLVATIEFSGALLVQVACSFASALHRQALIVGTEGVIQTTFFNHPSPASPPVLQLKRGKGPEAIWETLTVPAINGFQAEAEAFEQLIRQGVEHWNGTTPTESIDIQLTIEALLQSARTGKWVNV
jgi:predicted dehydrogenase